MVELQIINKIISEKSLGILTEHGLGTEHFISYKPEIEFIFDHYMKYGQVPDMATFLNKFENFDVLQVEESREYLLETICEQYLFYKIAPFVHEVASKAETDAREAIKFIQANIDEFIYLMDPHKKGFDIISQADDRKREVKRRMDIDGLLGISTGIDELDKVLHGWLPEDFTIITGRTGEGKTWVLLYFLMNAWRAGKRVLLYSGEMSKTMVGFRFDTLYKHFSNLGLLKGSHNLGDKTVEDYFDYLDTLKESKVPFIVITPNDIGGRLDIPTLHGLIEKYKPDIVGIDQMSLMNDFRAKKGDPTRIQYTHIAEDLYLTSEKYGIPVLSPVQANRAATKDKDNPPKNENVAESDGVPQNATRNIAITQQDKTLKMSVRKNRYGLENTELLFVWDIDNGYIKPFLHVQSDENEVPITTKVLTGEDLF